MKIVKNSNTETSEFELVSTQMLQRILDKDKPEPLEPVEPVVMETGFDPYNSD